MDYRAMARPSRGRRSGRVRWRFVCITSASLFLVLVAAILLVLEFGYCQWHPYIYMWQTMRDTGRNNMPPGYTGTWRHWFFYGDSRFTDFRNGKAHGRDVYWFANGNKAFQSEFRDGVEHGVEIVWHEDGRLCRVRPIENGEFDGAAVFWHRSGKLGSLYQYRRDTLTGRAMAWDAQGQLIADGVWRDGRPWEGSVLIWDAEHGRPKVIATYREGEEIASKLAPHDAPPAP